MVGAVGAAVDDDDGEGHVQEESDLHGEVEAVLDEQRHTLVRAGAAAGGEPHGVVVAAPDTAVARDTDVLGTRAAVLVAWVGDGAADDRFGREEVEDAGPVVEVEVRLKDGRIVPAVALYPR